MSWTVDSIRVYVSGFATANKNIIAKLQPLEGETIVQYFGYEMETARISGKVIGDSDAEAVRALAKSGDLITLSLSGVAASGYVETTSVTRDPAICQTVTATRTDPVYNVEIELSIPE